ncbi:MAG: hypothetical protein COV00_00285 [Candidatus Tagabacteria bacterium CG10_big_fil_rev_8_21_14_0_10_40_13]|uniref:GAF domain-containing protein n=1 Tax=Candidatus Tagabacteria bacterium CG10_big_fil_rev_8_21_14_0_10_40_13 TaxID=1975022 RepID=A0A2M8L9Q3_9BACT|nr:MAG: hypothetical protein COV00_00285 [Candidatus Tagabacteria bacterium CG10_big_fil_rev_8_21_14_0_10_40_13]
MAKKKFDREQILSFLELIEAITLTESYQKTLEKLLEKTAEVLDVQQGCILLANPKNSEELVIECAFEQKARPKGHRINLTLTAHPNLYKAIFQNAVFVRKGGPEEDVEQVLYIRLQTEEFLGVMVFGAKGEKKEFNPDDILIAQAISHLAIASIQHGRIIEKNERLKTIISERMSLADEIRNPLMSAGGFAKRAFEKLNSGESGIDPKILEYLKRALKNYQRVENLLGELLKTK